MLLKITHIGTDHTSRDGHRRLYFAQSPTGRDAVIALCAARVDYGQDARVEIRLEGTEYLREYPACGELNEGTAPTIADLEGGYQTVSSFLLAWECATPEQRADLWLYDKPVFFPAYGGGQRSKIRKRQKWPVRQAEDRPRIVKGKPGADGWIRVYRQDIKAAIKGTKSAVRFGSVTVKPAILRQLVDSGKNGGTFTDDVLELKDQGGELAIRSVDGRAKVTIKHGAGDPYAGRNGFEARIAVRAN